MPDTHSTTPGSPRRFELGQQYRLPELRPGTIVVREANFSGQSIVTGSPCCRRLTKLHLIDLHRQITQRANGFAVGDDHSRRCLECRARYRLRVPANTIAELYTVSTVEWKVS
ncbi:MULTISPECIES: hypothetical protein [unclassified Nocardia]|uniref:hypothetical protein n=1 Tax=unclassified Nocardia TaxID=2637762 RepID=UPI001CE3F4A4|nr:MULTISPECIES: hypothetical protein [unclassified Nocardia]